ncbi:MAG: filamentous hemagglutinin N-terminal domain-containing protein, partial [Sedimentisphaerales bacterium]|nr:filamentous hemagglutinin N-terminal domain-containing protein [Sedimentisphaerales bacterium]
MRKYRRQKLSYVEKALRQRRLADMAWFRHVSLIMLAGWLGLMPSWSYAGPQGEQVVAGDVSFDRNGNLTEITASHNSIINYDSFNIGSDETVRFIQPTESSRVLNRIQGDDPTTIAGRLLSNGQVYIVNPAGIYFTNGSLVDVGALYAAAGSITDSEFIAGNDHFSQVTGEVVNDGRIMAQTVALVGQFVANNGEIISQDGLITLAVGDDVFVTRQGSHIMVRVGDISDETVVDRSRVDNTGVINAGKGEVSLVSGDMYALAMGVSNSGTVKGSAITLESGENGITKVTGIVDASDLTEGQTGGNIRVLGDRVAVLGGQIDASGSVGGGEILIGGDFQGKGEVRNARLTPINKDADIKADAIDSGDGGRVICWADQATYYQGEISVKGGAESGDGGFVEVSGKENLHFTGGVDLSAENGDYGSLLLDPQDVGIVGDAWDNPTHNTYLTDDNIILEGEYVGQTLYIGQTAIESLVGNITIYANNQIAMYGLAGSTLNLQTAAGSTVSFLVDQNNNSAGDVFESDYSGPANNIVTAGGNVVISAENVTIDSITTNGGDVTIRALELDLKTAINAGAGNVHIYPKTSASMDLGDFDDGLHLSDTSLNRIFTSGILTLGDSVNTISMELEGVGDIAGVTGTVRFLSDGFIRSTNGYPNTITTPKVEILADDHVTLNSFLAVADDLVINADYDDDGTGTLTLDAVDDTISSTNGNISITAADLVFNNTGATKISTANGNIAITASDSRSMAITNTVYDFRITDAELDRIVATGTVTLDTASDFRFNAATSYTGNLAVVSGGSVSQASDVTVTGNLSVTADVSGGSILLDRTGNNVSGTVSLATLGTGDATWTESGSVDLGTVNVGDALTVRSNTDTIVQTGVITAGGNATFTTSANDKAITLNTQSNAVGGTVAFTTNATAGDVAWKEAAAVSLAASTVDGNLTVVSDAGGISNAGTLTVSGTGTFTASTNNQAIDLNNSLNNITGAVAFATGGTSGNVYFDNGSNAIDLATSNIGGLLDLDTGGHLTVSGDVLTARAMTINADDITLNGSLNSGGYNITILPDDNGTIGLGNAVGGMTLTDAELDKITSLATVRFDTNSAITADTITPANITGTLWLDSAAGVTFSGGGSTFVNHLTVSGNDLAISQAVNVTGNMLISAVGVPVYLGTAGGNMSIDGGELELITAANLEVNAGTGQHIYVNNVSAANSANISGTVTLDSSQQVIFQTNGSSFRALTVEADDGIQVNNGITLATTVGGMSLDGNTALPNTTMTTSGNVTLNSAGLVTLNATTLGGNLAINAADLEVDATLNYGANTVIVTASGSVDVGDDNGGTMVLSQADLLALSGTGPLSVVTAAGDIVVDNVSQASSDNIDGLLTLSATGDTYEVIFNGANSTFNTLTVNATDGIDIDNVMLATDVGALTLSPNTDGGPELITFTGANAGMATATDFSLGSISVTGALTLRANGDITFTASQSAPGGFNIYADNDGNGSGVFTLNNGLSMTTTNADINITGMDLILEDGATLNAGTGDISFGTQSATTLYLGGGLNSFGISDAELDRMTATEVIFGGVSSAEYSAIIVDGDLSAGTKILTLETNGTLTVNDGFALSTTDKAISISARDLNLSTTGAINAGTGLLSLNTVGAFTDIDLGGTGQEFNVSDSELSRLTAGGLTATVLAGNDIYVSGISDADGANVGAITLVATGADSQIIIDTDTVQVDSLSASASDGITVNRNITTDIGDLILEGDSDNADDGNLQDNLAIANGLTFSSAGSITLSATTGGIDAAGALTLNAVDGVTLSDAYNASGAGVLTVDADTNDDGTGIFTTGSTVNTVDSLISITAGDIELGGELTAGTGGISILPSDTGGQTVVFGGVGGNMTLSAVEVGYLNTSGTLTVGNANTTGLTIGADATDVTGNLVLVSTGAGGNIVVNSAITPDGTLNMTARDGITVNDDITTVGSITIDADNDDNGGLLTVGAGAIIDSTDTVIAITAGDIDINATGGLDSGTTAMSITQSQAAGTIGLGATGGTMTLADSELDRITATGLTIYAPSNVTVNGVTAGGGNVSGTFLVDASGKVTFATGGSDFNTLEIQADDGVEVNGVVVSTTVGSILIDGNVDNSADGTDTIAFIGTAELDANTTLTLTATNDGITSAGVTDLEANAAVLISDKYVAASDLTVTSNNSTVTFSNDLTGGGATNISADDGVTFNGNVSLGGATVVDADVDAGDNNGTFTLLAGKTITTNGNTLTIIGDNVNLAGNIAGGAGLLTLEVSDSGSVGLADGAGNFQLDSAELTRITGQTGGLTIQGAAAQVTVDGMTTDSNLAGISGLVTIDASNNGGKVAFSGAVSKFTSLTVRADRGISSSVDLTTTNGNMSLDGDWDNANDLGSDGIVLTGGRTLTAINGAITLAASTDGISDSGALTLYADAGIN